MMDGRISYIPGSGFLFRRSSIRGPPQCCSIPAVAFVTPRIHSMAVSRHARSIVSNSRSGREGGKEKSSHHATRACNLCRKRKQRCTVQDWCISCQSLGEECHHRPCTFCVSKGKQETCQWTGLDMRKPVNKTLSGLDETQIGAPVSAFTFQLNDAAPTQEVPAFGAPPMIRFQQGIVNFRRQKGNTKLRITTDQLRPNAHFSPSYTSSERTPILSAATAFDPMSWTSPLSTSTISPAARFVASDSWSPDAITPSNQTEAELDPFFQSLLGEFDEFLAPNAMTTTDGYASIPTFEDRVAHMIGPLPSDQDLSAPPVPHWECGVDSAVSYIVPTPLYQEFNRNESFGPFQK